MTNSTLVAFVQLVAGMRRAQRQYFKTRSREDLLRAKDFEGLVDTAVLGLTAPEPEPELPWEGARP